MKEKKKINKDYLTAPKKADKKRMKEEIKKNSKKADNDSSAYKKWTADHKQGDTKKDSHKTKTSEYTKKYKEKYKKESYSMTFESFILEKENYEKGLKNKSEETGIPYRLLKKVYNKGLAAWKTGHRPGASQHQWAMGRVNSFIVGGPARKSDKEIWDEWKDIKKKNKGKNKK